MKKAYIKPEMEIQEFAAEDMIMSSSSECVNIVHLPCDTFGFECLEDFGGTPI